MLFEIDAEGNLEVDDYEDDETELMYTCQKEECRTA